MSADTVSVDNEARKSVLILLTRLKHVQRQRLMPELIRG